MSNEKNGISAALVALAIILLLAAGIVIGLSLSDNGEIPANIGDTSKTPGITTGQGQLPRPPIQPKLTPTPASIEEIHKILNTARTQPVVFGHITNQHQMALPKARIILLAHDSQNPKTFRIMAETRSNSNGFYQIDAPRTGDYNLLVKSYGFIPKAQRGIVFATPDESRQLDFVLSPGGVISGMVTDPGGQPVEGVEVYATLHAGLSVRKKNYRLSNIPDKYRQQVRIPAEKYSDLLLEVDEKDSPFKSTTDYTGRYELAGLPRDHYDIRSETPRFAPAMLLDVTPGNINADISLSPGGTITGIVTSRAGEPLPGVDIEVLYKYWIAVGEVRGRMRYRLGSSNSRHIATQSDGGYLLDRLPAGEYDLLAKVSGYIMSTAFVDIASNEAHTGVDFQMEVESVVTGRLSDSEGKPLYNGLVTAARIKPDSKGGIKSLESADYQARSNKQGQYRIDNLAPGKYWISASCPGYQSSGRDQVTIKEGSEVDGVDFLFTRRTSISGQVMDQRGKPIAGAHIKLSEKEMDINLEKALEIFADGGEFVQIETKTDQDGNFTLGNMKDRKYQLEFSASGYETQILELPAGMKDVRVELKMVK
jgi:Carboxypeptidase regulatory-like domain